MVHACLRATSFVERCGYRDTMCIDGMVGTNEIVLSACNRDVHSYVIYYNVESKTITKVGVQGIEAFQGKECEASLSNFISERQV